MASIASLAGRIRSASDANERLSKKTAQKREDFSASDPKELASEALLILILILILTANEAFLSMKSSRF